jgi:hypothetical protein
MGPSQGGNSRRKKEGASAGLIRFMSERYSCKKG